ncbi:ABC transporter G family member 39-like [Rhododendron vialii]|uniref:ABC transporter G family member 39-like n=1 Tax=Rhododendron vialii TaxID=182163 RepID=UPI00265EA15A|nr:ABC transporter G family member 39-like [Rhododendron vialii]
MRWGYYISPMMYGQNAIAMNEFLDKRWSTPNSDPRFPEPTVGKVILKARGMFVDDYMYWVCVIALFGFSVLFNICFIAALAYLNPLGDSKSVIMNDDDEVKKKKRPLSNGKKQSTDRSINMGVRNTPDNDNLDVKDIATRKRGMEMKSRGIEEARLQLLQDVSGAFRPGVLTALVGVIGARKTTLMDVLAGRKTGGYIEGCICISGFPKNQATFARISSYYEQNDIHSPHVTVHESIGYSAWLRLAPDVNKETRKGIKKIASILHAWLWEERETRLLEDCINFNKLAV